MGRSRISLVFMSLTVLLLVTLLGGVLTAAAGEKDGGVVVPKSGGAQGSEGTPTLDPVGLNQDGAGKTAVPGSPGETAQSSGSISGTVYLQNNKGLRVPWDGVTVLLNGGSPTQTANSGGYSFTGLTPGTYTVSVVVPQGYLSTSPDDCSVKSVSVTASNPVRNGVDFYCAPASPTNASAVITAGSGSISGHAWDDSDWDGMYDPGEPPAAGETVELWLNGTRIKSVATGTDGSYAFTALDAGTYTVKFIVPIYAIATTPTSVTFYLSPNGSVGGIDFLSSGTAAHGLVLARVFEDTNHDGKYQTGERFLNGIKITLYIKGKADWDLYSWQKTYSWLFGFWPGFVGFFGTPTLYWRPYASMKLVMEVPAGYHPTVDFNGDGVPDIAVEFSIGWLNFFAYYAFGIAK